ncbi:MAG: hypothetical protein OEZ34_10180 [Spirochaetia bacterium]|nr:hypothetical protein [Spirochaetia bacterium]
MNKLLKSAGFIIFIFSLFTLSADPFREKPRYIIRYNQAFILNAVFTADSKKIITAEDKKIRIWNAESGELISTIDTLKNVPQAVHLSKSGKLLITGAYGGSSGEYVKVWNLEKKKQVGNLVKMSNVSDAAISPDDSLAAVSGAVFGDKDKRSLTLWNLRNGKKIATLKTADGYIPMSLLFTPDSGKLLVAVTGNQEGIEIWNLKTKSRENFIKTESEVTSLAFSPDEKSLAAGIFLAERRKLPDEGIIRFYSFPSLEKLRDLPSQKGFISSLSFHPGGRYLVSGIYHTLPNLVIWDLKSGLPYYTNSVKEKQVLKAKFSPDGKFLTVIQATFGNLGNPATLKMFDTDQL